MPKISRLFKLQTIFRDKKNMIYNKILKNLRKGQATVEYILLLVILVFIVTGMKEVFFKPFNTVFMPAYKNYYVCFMERAALPGTVARCPNPPSWNPTLWPAGSGSGSSWSGGGGGSSWSGGGGSSWSGGGGSSWSGGGGSSWSGGGGGSSWSGGGGSSWSGGGGSSWSGGGGGSSWSGGGGGSSWGSDSNNRSPWGEYSSSNNNSTGVSKIPKDSFPISGKGKNNNLNSSNNNQFLVQSSSEGLDSDLDDKRKRKQKRKKFKIKRKKGDTSTLTSAGGNRSNRRSSQGDRFLMSGGAYDFEENEEEKRETAIAVQTEKSNKKGNSERKASFVVDAKNKQQTQIEEEGPITFGKFLKYIFIGLLILGIFFFIGSQLMQVNENLKAS